MSKIHIVGFTGSLRHKSFNAAALRAAAELVPADAELEILSLGELPLYNQDLEHDEPSSVRYFKERAKLADAFLIVTPEYNYSVPGVLKNALDWASRPRGHNVMVGKPTAMMGVGGRFGTVRAQLHLREILLEMEVPVLGKPEVHVSSGWEKFDEEGNLHDDRTREQIRHLLARLVAEAQTQLVK